MARWSAFVPGIGTSPCVLERYPIMWNIIDLSHTHRKESLSLQGRGGKESGMSEPRMLGSGGAYVVILSGLPDPNAIIS